MTLKYHRSCDPAFRSPTCLAVFPIPMMPPIRAMVHGPEYGGSAASRGDFLVFPRLGCGGEFFCHASHGEWW